MNDAVWVTIIFGQYSSFSHYLTHASIQITYFSLQYTRTTCQLTFPIVEFESKINKCQSDKYHSYTRCPH